MKKYKDGPVAQGEILFIKVNKIPKGLEEAEVKNDQIIVGHSETGHHHVLTKTKSNQAKMLIDKTNSLIAYLQIKDDADIVHLRQHNTHETIKLPVGDYMIRYRAEDTPEGWKRVAD